jgi:hypothetical protein
VPRNQPTLKQKAHDMTIIRTSQACKLTASPFFMMLRIATLACVVTAAPQVLAGTDQDTVRWDDRAGQWVYTLFNPADLSRSKEVRYTPRTLIEPLVKSSVRWDINQFEYRYRIKNGAGARQPISEVSVVAPKWDAEAIKHAPLRPGMTGPEIQVAARAQVAAEEAFVARTLYSPMQWRPFLNVNRPARVVFGWLVNYEENYKGIAPRSAQRGFSVLRAELPGAGWMEFQGDTADMYNAPTLPGSGAVADQVAQVLAEDSVYVAAMVPAIVVPQPYDSAELARRIKTHVATWPDAGLMTPDRFTALTPKFDALIKAATDLDQKAIRAAAVAIMVEAFTHHPGMTHNQTDDDEDEHDSKAPKRIFISPQGALTETNEADSPLHRVAARALVFDMMYLLARTGR